MEEKKSNTETINPFGETGECCCCPRDCHARRDDGDTGYCGSDAGFNISSVWIHKGEEPVISGQNGICNIFFSRCNLSCVYCQNWQISRNRGEVLEARMTLSEITGQVIHCLDQGCHAVGFVSPSHYIPHVRLIINELKNLGRSPVFVYNSNGYDRVEQLKSLEGSIDVYLPDFKYMDQELARDLSGAADYPSVAMNALKEMFRQKGSALMLDDKGQAEHGLIIRHLILPGHIQNSIRVLRWIAEELSASLAISLLSQYYPVPAVMNRGDLNRCISAEEYEQVVEEMYRIGFNKGWVQHLESRDLYRPDFSKEHPFGV